MKHTIDDDVESLVNIVYIHIKLEQFFATLTLCFSVQTWIITTHNSSTVIINIQTMLPQKGKAISRPQYPVYIKRNGIINYSFCRVVIVVILVTQKFIATLHWRKKMVKQEASFMSFGDEVAEEWKFKVCLRKSTREFKDCNAMKEETSVVPITEISHYDANISRMKSMNFA